jgi:hypothetical protein
MDWLIAGCRVFVPADVTGATVCVYKPIAMRGLKVPRMPLRRPTVKQPGVTDE